MEVARGLSEGARVEDVVGRIGGEEFVVIMSATSDAVVAEAADRFRRTDADTEIGDAGPPLRVALSGGYALYPTEGASWDELFGLADERLYLAKQAGRNRVRGPEPAEPRLA